MASFSSNVNVETVQNVQELNQHVFVINVQVVTDIIFNVSVAKSVKKRDVVARKLIDVVPVRDGSVFVTTAKCVNPIRVSARENARKRA